jgi:hypothetical protein
MMEMRTMIKNPERVIKEMILEMLRSEEKKVGEVGDVGEVP